MEHDLTSGKVFPTLISFSIPYLVSYFLQTLYGMADLFIIGRFCAVEATTAVSIGSQVMHMLTVMIVGLAMGTTVKIGHAIGSGDRNEVNRIIGNTVVLFAGIAVVSLVLLSMCVRPIVSLMSTPEEAAAGTVNYLLICFIGIPFVMAYNVISSIFRGLGDSKTPMYFVTTACVVNILLDYLFIGGCGLGPAGAALGTTLAQGVSVILALIYIRKMNKISGLSRADFRPKKETLLPILQVGIPVAAQDGLIQISFLLITVFANLRGLTDAAAVGIVEKIISFLFLIPSSMLSAVSALAAQNIGAGKHDRVRLTLRYALCIAVGMGFVWVILMQFAADSAVALFTKDPAAIAMGGEYMRGYVWDCVFAGIHFCFSGYFCAYGKSWISFLQNILSIVLARVPLAWYTARFCLDSLFPMGLAAPAGSLLSVVVCLIAYKLLRKNSPELQGK